MEKSYKMNIMVKRFIILIILFFIPCLSACEEPVVYEVLIGRQKEEMLSDPAHRDILVIDAALYSNEDIQQLKKRNRQIYSYLNIGSVEAFRDPDGDWTGIWLAAYENWEEEHWVDVSDRLWQSHIFSSAHSLKNKGIDGFFLDNADVYEIARTEEVYEGLYRMTEAINELGLPVILNGGSSWIDRMIKEERTIPAAGVNQEEVYTTIDFEGKRFQEANADDTVYAEAYLDRCREAGLQIYLLEYSDDAQRTGVIKETCRRKRYVCSVTDSIELDQRKMEENK